MAVDIDKEARALRRVLERQGLHPFRVVKRGKNLLIVDGPEQEPDLHARLIPVGQTIWRLDLRRHTDRWEATPFVGNLEELVDTLVGIGRLDLGSHADDNWSETSDP